MPTRVLVYWNAKASRVEVDIDASHRVTAIRRVGTPAAVAVARRPDNSQSYSLGRDQTEIAIPTSPGGRLQLTYDAARDRYDGLAGEVLTEG